MPEHWLLFIAIPALAPLAAGEAAFRRWLSRQEREALRGREPWKVTK